MRHVLPLFRSGGAAVNPALGLQAHLLVVGADALLHPEARSHPARQEIVPAGVLFCKEIIGCKQTAQGQHDDHNRRQGGGQAAVFKQGDFLRNGRCSGTGAPVILSCC